MSALKAVEEYVQTSAITLQYAAVVAMSYDDGKATALTVAALQTTDQILFYQTAGILTEELINVVYDNSIALIRALNIADSPFVSQEKSIEALNELRLAKLGELRSHSNNQVWPTKPSEPEQYEHRNDEDAPENDNDFWSGLLGR